jgi:hypothetical protein
MAAENHNPEDLLTTDGGKVSMSIARQRAALLASYEVEQFSLVLREERPADDLGYVTHGIAMRLEQMAQVIMSAIGEDGVAVESLYKTLGREMPNVSDTEQAIA